MNRRSFFVGPRSPAPPPRSPRNRTLKFLAQTSACASASSGLAWSGRIHARSFHGLNESKVVGVSDCYRPRMDACAELAGSDCAKHSDFRKLLERKDVDAVVAAPADHWHALQTMLACDAGKDVYVEKPLHLFVREGEWMQKVAARTKRVVQVGTQQRSALHYHKARELLRGGAIGDLVSVQCNFFRNVMPGIGNPPDGDAPADLDWNMLLGPAPQRRYNPNRAIYHFRWFWDYSGGQMTNLGHHSLDSRPLDLRPRRSESREQQRRPLFPERQRRSARYAGLDHRVPEIQCDRAIPRSERRRRHDEHGLAHFHGYERAR
jgi:hypothetical protein